MSRIKMIKNEKIIREFFKDEFDMYKNVQKEEIYNEKSRSVEMHCTCSDAMPAITVAKSQNDNFFIRNNPGQGKKHISSCSLHSEYESDNESEKGWTIDIDNNHIANLSKSAFGKKNKKKPIVDNEEQKNIRHPSRQNGKGSSKVTLLGLMMRLNILTWNRYIEDFNKTPESLGEFMKKAYGSSNFIGIKGSKSLNDCWYDYKKFKNLKPKEHLFVFMPVITVQPIPKNTNFCKVVLSFFVNNKQTEVKISCPMSVFEEARNSVRSVSLKKDDKGFNAIVGGFIQKNKKGYREFVSMEFMPIIPEGLWCESSYEKEVYSKLVVEERLFSKGYGNNDMYGNSVPDIIFRDTKKITFGEIFGIQNIESYTKKKEEKIELAKSSTDLFDFWYWDVPNEKTMREFPEKMNNIDI